jgi:hypothetical protein
MYAAQLKKINAALNTMHEDFQYDYRRELASLELENNAQMTELCSQQAGVQWTSSQ